ncbi:MAG: sulfotransferase [Halieaceae bacterium]|nr:sulfotransferase [Halieaceae bacterium]
MASLQQITNLVQARSLDKAAVALAKLLQKKGKSAVDWRQAANLASTLGDQDLVLAALQKWRDEAPADPHRQIAVINALGAVARHRDAARAARKLQGQPEAGAEGYYLEAYYLARFGKTEEALALYRKALQMVPQHTPAWEQIALLGGYQDVETDIAAMEQLAATLTNPQQLIPLCYGLGRAYDATGDYDTAFLRIQRGAQLREQVSPFKVQPQLDYYRRLQGSFSAERIDRWRNPAGGAGAVFVLGAPRSGTTLVEQILATANDVTATGEHMLMRVASLPLASMEPPDMQRAEQFARRDWQQMAQAYQGRLQRRFSVGKYFTDKSLLNHNYAGLAAVLFPEARFIWLKRDPRDVAWSCFRSRISGNQWAQSLQGCLQYLAGLDTLCSHWVEVLGDRIAVLDYEALVTDPDTSSAMLFGHAGLERPGNWLEFHRRASPVATASLAQVRKPLSTSAVGSWRRYEKQLAPVYAQAGLA